MRKVSYLFLTLGVLSPFVAEILARRVTAEYRARTGFDPEGIGLGSIFILGAGFAFLFFLLSAIYATRAYRRITKPRPLLRKVELTAFWLPLLLTFILICLLLLGGLVFTHTQVIQTR